MNIAQVRAQYPQYQDLSDQQLADALHAKFYSDIPIQDYYSRIGLTAPEKESVFRQVADVPLGIAKGAVQGVRMIADAFGAGSDTSKTIKSAETYLADLMSAQAKNDQQEISRIMKDAEDKGVLDQVKAAVKAFSVAPVDTLSSALGTAAPVIVGALGAKVLGAGALVSTGVSALTGAGMGAGTIKGSIYEETKNALKEAGASEQDAEARAKLAQEYNGKNLDQILLGTVLGGAAALGPLEKGGAAILARRILGKTGVEATESVAEQAAKGAVRRRLEAGALEAIPEAVQAGQEQVAQNIALQREGFDVPTFRGAVGAATLEGLAGAGLGATVGGGKPEVAPVKKPSISITDEIAPITPPGSIEEALTQLTPQQKQELERQRVLAERPKTTEELLAETGIQTGRPTTAEDIARIRDEHETAVIDGLLAQDAEMKRANELAALQREQQRQQTQLESEAEAIAGGIADIDSRVREGRIFSSVQDLIDRNIPFASTAISDINQKFGVINEAPLNEEERARIENIMGMVNTFTNFVNLPVLAPKPVDQFAENQAMEALIKERTERGPTEPLRAAPPAPSPRIEEAPVSQGVGEGAALRPTGGVEPSVAEDRERVAPTPPTKPTAFESQIVSRQPAPDGMEVHVFATTDGYGTGLFDADAGQYVNGSVTRFAGADTLPKAEARAAEMLRKATPAAPAEPSVEPLGTRKEAQAFGKAIGATQPYPGELRGRVNLPAQKAAKEGNFQGVLSALEKSKNVIVAEIAKRARALGTKIVIDDDAEETYTGPSTLMRQMSIDGAKMHLEALNKIRALAPQVDALPDKAELSYAIRGETINAIDGGESAGRMYLEDIAKMGHSMFAPLPIGESKFKTKEDFKRLQRAYEDLTSEYGENALQLTSTGSAQITGVAGVYDAATDTIRVPEYTAKREEVLSHEIVHAQTVQAIANPTLRQKPIVARLNKLYEHVKKELEGRPGRAPYGIQSIQEFVAEGMGNPAFQFLLKKIKYENTSAWDSFVQTIANLIGVKRDTAFTELLSIYSDLTTEQKAAPKAEAPAVETPSADVAQQVKDLREQQTKLLTKSGKVPAPRSPARQKYDVLERQIAELEDRPLAVRTQKPRKPPKTIMGSPMLAGIFNKIGGLHTSLLPEFSTRFFTKKLDKKGRPIIMVRNPMIPGYGTLFNKNGKFDFGEIAEHLEEEGYLEPGSLERDYKDAGERAKELVKRALNGEEVLPIEDQIAKDNFEREASERQKALDRQEENRQIATGELQLEPEFELTDKEFEENLGLDREFETDLEMYNLEPRDLEFLSDEELESELTDAEREQAQARRTRKAEADAARQKAEGVATGEDEALLTRPTAEGLRAKQEAAEKAAAEDKRAKAAEQERLRKEQQAKEEKARADETVKDFELGKSAEEQMTGMGDLFAEPPAPPKREPRQGTPKQLETAEKIAKPFGATVVYQDGDLALMRGFSKGNGQPVYMAINLPYYFEKDIEYLKFPKDLVTPEQRTELIKIKQNLEAEDKIKFDKSPSIKFTDGLATSRNISPEIAGVVRGWKDLLGLKVNLYITTVGDAIADRNRFNGPHRAVGSAGINDREAGVVRKLPNGDYYIAFKISTSKTKMLEVIAHELGHIHELEVFNRADKATRQQILDEHSKWLKRQTGKTAREFVTALRAKTAGKTTRIGEGMMASEMDSRYWKAFTEWYADQVSRWAVTSEKPISVVEKFFSRLAQALKSFYSKLKNAGYLPNETFVQYLNKTHQPSDHVITPDEGIAGQMLGEVEPTGTPGQQALETINRMGMGVKPPEPGRIEKAKAYLKEAGENPAATKESAKQTLTKWLDAFETMAFSGDAAFNNKVTSSVIKDMKEQPELLGLLLEASQSQAVNADNVVSRGIIEGSIEYNEEMKKWQSVKKDENFSALAKKLDDLAKKYGTSKEEMERIAHTYLVVKRLPGIIQRNKDLDAAIEKEQATDKPDRKRIDEWKALKVYVSPEQEAQVEPGLSLIKTIPELKEVSDIWQGIRQNTIKAMVDSGLWSTEYATNMFDNIDYVPYYREEQLEEGAGPLEFIRGLQVKSKEFQLKGSGAPVNDVFDNMIRWSQYAMSRAIRAQKARQMIDAAKDIDIGDRKMAVQVTEEKRGMNIVRVFRDGKQELWDMADPMFVPAFAAIQNVSIPMFKWAAKVADVLRNSVVLYPMFSVAQVPQDSFAAMFTSGLKPQHALKIPILAVKEFVKTLNKSSATHNELVKFGVVGARDFSADVMRKDAEIYAGLKPPKGGWGKTKEILEHIAMAADNAVRQAVYEASVDQGLSKAEALEKAFEIFNVRRRGTSKALNLAGQTIPFFYAYLAAQRVAYRTITGVGTSPTERKAALQTLAATSAAVFTLSMLYAMAVGDDEDYAETPAAVRDRTLTIPGTGGVRIPLRTDFFLFPKMIAEHTYLMLTDKGYEDGAKFRRSMRDALVSAVASPTPLPQVIKPALEVAINYDFFTGKPVIGQFEKKKDWERQFNDSTSEFSKLLGKTGLVSPIAADHLIRGMFGSAGGLVMYASNFFTSDPDVPRPELSVNEMLAALPGTSGFLKRPQESALKNDFYTLRDEVEKAVNTFNDIKTRSPQGMEAFLADEKQMARLMLGKPVDKINREIAKIRRQMTIITNMPENQMSAEDKADNIRQLREMEREMLKSVNVKELRQMAKI